MVGRYGYAADRGGELVSDAPNSYAIMNLIDCKVRY